MPKPIIISVDDEPQVLNAIERDLRARYQADYRIMKAHSGVEALEAVRELKRRGSEIALLLVDQRMPQMSGTEFLDQARDFYPQARKVLLTAYADTEAAIASINQIGLDYYLMKPWHPPEQNLYPVLDDLLSDWRAAVVPTFDGLRVIGTQWSADSHRLKDFLTRNQIPYHWLDVEADAKARQLLEDLPQEERSLPVVLFPEGDRMANPERRQLVERIGLSSEAQLPFYDYIVIGGGPAGLAAGVYGASEGLKTLLIEAESVGGQAGTSARIENYLGFPKGLSGADLARRAAAQAKRLGCEILTAREVVGIRREDPYRFVQLANGEELSCHAVLLATGVHVRRLEAPGVAEHTGAGVYYGAAVTEAASVKGERVFVVGGANSAGQGIVFLSRYAKQVTAIVRGSALENGMSQYLVDQIEALDNVDVRLRTVVEEAQGEGKLERIIVRNIDSDERETLNGRAMFIFIGAVPRTEFIRETIACDRAGFALTGADLSSNGARPAGWGLPRDPLLFETSMPGVFAAGDVRHGSVKRVATAIGEGSGTLYSVHRYLKTI